MRAEIASLAERVSAAERDHAAPEAAHDDAAAAALAAADVRDALGMPGAADRWRHVAERFAGTHEAVEARARLAAVSAGEDRR
ncbi:MAG: hypothetical protein HMLKMBBP_03431 [Planctomycetes bacterium]|nr:hypothetical protein [Planctomycetota bacterium]